jgi:hypothetical protein
MPEHYVDRGIVKWQPFDALVGYHQILKELKYQIGQIEKPTLSDDALETLNRHLRDAIESGLEVELSYYQNGYIKETYGVINKVDYVTKRITLSTGEKIRAEHVLNIELITL